MSKKRIGKDKLLKSDFFVIIIGVLCLIGLCFTGYIKWSAVLILVGVTLLLILVPIFAVLVIKLPERIRRLQYDRMFNWILKHKEELPLSQEEKDYFIESNRKYIAIDYDYYKELRNFISRSSCKHRRKTFIK